MKFQVEWENGRRSYLPIDELKHERNYKRETLTENKDSFEFFDNLFPLLFLSPSYKDTEEETKPEVHHHKARKTNRDDFARVSVSKRSNSKKRETTQPNNGVLSDIDVSFKYEQPVYSASVVPEINYSSYHYTAPPPISAPTSDFRSFMLDTFRPAIQASVSSSYNYEFKSETYGTKAPYTSSSFSYEPAGASKFDLGAAFGLNLGGSAAVRQSVESHHHSLSLGEPEVRKENQYKIEIKAEEPQEAGVEFPNPENNNEEQAEVRVSEVVVEQRNSEHHRESAPKEAQMPHEPSGEWKEWKPEDE